MNLHVHLGFAQGREAKLLIEELRVARDEAPAADSLQLGMIHDGAHQELAEATTAMRVENENVCDVGERSVVGDDAREADLLNLSVFRLLIDPEAERVLDGARHHIARNALRPVAVCEEVMDAAEIQARAIGGDDVVALSLVHEL